MNIFEKMRRKRLNTSEQITLMFRDSFDDADLTSYSVERKQGGNGEAMFPTWV